MSGERRSPKTPLWLVAFALAWSSVEATLYVSRLSPGASPTEAQRYLRSHRDLDTSDFADGLIMNMTNPFANDPMEGSILPAGLIPEGNGHDEEVAGEIEGIPQPHLDGEDGGGTTEGAGGSSLSNEPEGISATLPGDGLDGTQGSHPNGGEPIGGDDNNPMSEEQTLLDEIEGAGNATEPTLYDDEANPIDALGNETADTAEPTASPTSAPIAATTSPTAAPSINWHKYTQHPTHPVTAAPTEVYVPPDDDPLQDVDDDFDDDETSGSGDAFNLANMTWDGLYQDAQQELDKVWHDDNLVVIVVSCTTVFLFFLLCVMQQVLEYPHGCCATICRCILATIAILCWPCRRVFCCCCTSQRAKDRRTHDLMRGNDGTYEFTHDLELT